MRLICRWLAAAMVLVALGCRESTAPASSSVIGGNLLRLTVTSSASEVARGMPVTLQVRLANEGASPITLHFNDACQINPYILNSLGKTVLPEGGWRGCAGVLTNLTVTPGTDIVREFVWTGSTAFRSEEPLRPLPTGKYFFSAEVPSNEVTLRATLPVILN
jgi:intracellular proteinase inhibitor BsuPI